MNGGPSAPASTPTTSALTSSIGVEPPSFPPDLFSANTSYVCTFVAREGAAEIPVTLWVGGKNALKRETIVGENHEIIVFTGSRLIIYGDTLSQGIIMGTYDANASLAELGVDLDAMTSVATNLSCNQTTLSEDFFQPPAGLRLIPADVVVEQVGASIEELALMGEELNYSRQEISNALCELCSFLPAGEERARCHADCRDW